MNNQYGSYQQYTVLANTFESRCRQDQLVQMTQTNETRMLHQLRIPQTSHPQVEAIIERLRLRLDSMNLPSVVGIDTHGSMGGNGYFVYSSPLHQTTSSESWVFDNQLVADPIQYILQLAQYLEIASQNQMFHQTLSPRSIYHYDEDKFLVFGLGIPALGSDPSVFSAPEIIEGGRMNQSSTVYTLGMMLFAQFGGSFLLGGGGRSRTYNRPYLHDRTLRMPSAIKKLISQSTQLYPDERMPDLHTFCYQASKIPQKKIRPKKKSKSRFAGLRKKLQPTRHTSTRKSSALGRARQVSMHSTD